MLHYTCYPWAIGTENTANIFIAMQLISNYIYLWNPITQKNRHNLNTSVNFCNFLIYLILIICRLQCRLCLDSRKKYKKGFREILVAKVTPLSVHTFIIWGQKDVYKTSNTMQSVIVLYVLKSMQVIIDVSGSNSKCTCMWKSLILTETFIVY